MKIAAAATDLLVAVGMVRTALDFVTGTYDPANFDDAPGAGAPSDHRYPDYAAEMKLPEGKSCDDCVHLARCLMFGFTSTGTQTSRDFHPSRFRETKVQG